MEKSWNCDSEFLWEPCLKLCTQRKRGSRKENLMKNGAEIFISRIVMRETLSSGFLAKML